MSRSTRRDFLKTLGAGAASLAVPGCAGVPEGRAGARAAPPNFIIIFCDDLGYGDIGCFGSKKHRTPHIDRMAAGGMRLTSFYVTAGVCTPSRASLMTGCYPRRVNMHQSARGEWVLFPVAHRGLRSDEITIAEVLKARGYATMCIGKWHLGDQPPFLPTRQGFDDYFGIPYSNDMGAKQRPRNPPLPLLRGEEVIEAPVDQNTLTKRYTEEAIRFIEANRDRPFLLYLPHSMPHNPVHASAAYRGRSANGRYGDAVEEIDGSTGAILRTLERLGIEGRTLVVFTSDNGAARRWGGSNAPLSGWKGSTMEGGMRVPCVARWPGRVPPGRTCDDICSTLDILPTFARLAGGGPPGDRVIDGEDIRPLLLGRAGARSPHEAFYYYFKDRLEAVRSGPWKLHLPRGGKRGGGRQGVRLYDVARDVGEKTDRAAAHPDVLVRLLALAERAREDVGDGPRAGAHQRPAGYVAHPVPLVRKVNVR